MTIKCKKCKNECGARPCAEVFGGELLAISQNWLPYCHGCRLDYYEASHYQDCVSLGFGDSVANQSDKVLLFACVEVLRILVRLCGDSLQHGEVDIF